MRPSPLAVFTVFCIGLQAIVGLCLGLSNGLSETHKTVLVGFIVCFPALTLLIFLTLMPKAETAEAPPFRSRKSELTPEPLGLASANRV
jgi:ABC-type dipeptide/oligopeptide/nickel transport system permease subunit